MCRQQWRNTRAWMCTGSLKLGPVSILAVRWSGRLGWQGTVLGMLCGRCHLWAGRMVACQCLCASRLCGSTAVRRGVMRTPALCGSPCPACSSPLLCATSARLTLRFMRAASCALTRCQLYWMACMPRTPGATALLCLATSTCASGACGRMCLPHRCCRRSWRTLCWLSTPTWQAFRGSVLVLMRGCPTLRQPSFCCRACLLPKASCSTGVLRCLLRGRASLLLAMLA